MSRNSKASLEMVATLGMAMEAKPDPVPPRMCLGAARCYVTVFGSKAKDVKAAAKKLGILWTHRGIYVGYDNFSGREYMKAEAIARELTKAGVDCYTHTDDD